MASRASGAPQLQLQLPPIYNDHVSNRLIILVKIDQVVKSEVSENVNSVSPNMSVIAMLYCQKLDNKSIPASVLC